MRIGALVFLLIVAALVTYKTSGSLAAVAGAHRTGTLGPRPDWVTLAPLPTFIRPAARALNYLWLVAVGMLIALPTFAEIPIALALMAAGAPLGVATALLIAGPSVNLASLLTVARIAGGRSALVLATGTALLAAVGGLIA